MDEYEMTEPDTTSDKMTAFDGPKIDLLDMHQWIYIENRYRLTPRELQIAKLACRGMSNNEIAGALAINDGTVKTHVRNIYRRIHVRSKVSMLLRFAAAAQNHAARHKPAAAARIMEVARAKKPKKATCRAAGRQKSPQNELGAAASGLGPTQSTATFASGGVDGPGLGTPGLKASDG